MAERIKLVQGDTGPQLKLTLTDDTSGTPMDLTGATVTMRFRAAGSETVLFSRTGYINPGSAALGETVIIWQTGDLNLNPGSYEGEVEVVFQDGMRQTVYDLLKFSLRQDFG